MRDLFVVVVITSLMPACFRRPFVGLLVFTWLAYMRVQDLSWGAVRGFRWSFYIMIITFAGFFANPKKMRFFLPDVRCWMMIALVVLLYLGVGFSQTGTFWQNKSQIGRMIEFAKIIGIALFTTAVVVNREHLRVLVWVIALSFAFFGIKSGLWGILTLGRSDIRTGPGGLLADNNDFALALVMAVPMQFHLAMSEKKEVLRKVFLYAVPLTMVTVALTHSRGGFLSLCGACGVLIWRSKNRAAGITCAIVAAVFLVLFGPSSFKERIGTLQNVEQDSSANARFRSWAVAVRMAVDNPWLGVGLDNFRQRYLEYQPRPTAKERAGEDIYVAHNAYLQIWAETGTLSLLLYLALIFMSFRTCWRVRKEAKKRYYASWMINYSIMFEASMTGFCIGSTFLNRAHFDLVYHLFAIVAVFDKVAMDELRQGSPTVSVEGYRGTGEVQRIRPVGFGLRPRVNGFRDTPLLGEGP